MRLIKKLILLFTVVSSPLLLADIYVDKLATGANDGSSWADAFTSIQTAVDSANDNDTILMAQGTYQAGAELTITKPLFIKGGYPTGGGVQNIANNPTILDGDQQYRVINATHATDTLLLEGLTIQNGKISGSNYLTGAGINSLGDLVLNRVNVLNNTASSSAASTYAKSYGGGIFTINASITLNNCIISGNTAMATSDQPFFPQSYGGGIYSGSGTITLTNSIFSNNIAAATPLSGSASIADGGGIYNGGGAITTLTNSQVSNNTVWSKSGALGGGVFGSTSLYNSILWGNNKTTNGGSTFIANEHQIGVLTANYSLIKDIYLNDSANTNNIDATIANFAADNFIDAANGNFGLSATSVLINAGNNGFLPADVYDLDDDGNTAEVVPFAIDEQPRIENATVDIGIYESHFANKNYASNASTYYFNQHANPSQQDGITWATAFSSFNDYFFIQDKSNISMMYLTEGTYFISGEITTATEINIIGGYDANTWASTSRISTLDVQHRNRVLYASENISLQNVGVKNGLLTNYNNGVQIVGGGGILVDKDITLINSQIANNTASFFTAHSHGGGILSSTGSISLVDSVVDSNHAISYYDSDARGGGIYSSSGTMSLINTLVANNNTFALTADIVTNAASHGGGVYAEGGSIAFSNSLVFNNTSTAYATYTSASRAYGGGIANFNGSINLYNSLVSDNTTNCYSTFVVDSRGGGVFTIAGSIVLNNAILWGNFISSDGGISYFASEYFFYGTENLSDQYSLIKGLNLTANNGQDASDPGYDPFFINEGGGDFSLLTGSPLIDAGDFNLLPIDEFDVDADGDLLERIPLDLAGMRRESGMNVEIGPYEFQSSYFVGGSVFGLLTGNALTLQNNNADDLILDDNGAFAFSMPVEIGMDYEVSLFAPPDDPIQPCTVDFASGTIVDADVMNVEVICALGDDLIFRDGF